MMAVPFNLPEYDLYNLISAVAFLLLQIRLEPEEQNQKLQECMEELARLLLEELKRRSRRSSQYDNQLKHTLSLLRQSLIMFTPRMRSNSECCDDEKLSVDDVDAAEKCISQVGLVLRKVADYEPDAILKEGTSSEKDFVPEETIFSRLTPGVRRTFWTAVPLICVVGWHLFQTCYC